MCENQDGQNELVGQSNQGPAGPNRSLADEPEFQELIERVEKLSPEDRQRLRDALLEDAAETELRSRAEWKPESKLPEYSPVCCLCKRLTDVNSRTCEAFPAGIPDAIWSGDNDHTQPFDGDGGLTFVARLSQP